MPRSTTNSAEKLRAYKKRWWKKNKNRMNNEVRAKPENRYKALKARAKREHRKFKLSFKVYLDKIKKGCYYCGADLMKEVGGNVDRRNNSIRDYTARNLVGCCADCNKIKSDRLTADEMVVAMKAVKRLRRRKNV